MRIPLCRTQCQLRRLPALSFLLLLLGLLFSVQARAQLGAAVAGIRCRTDDEVPANERVLYERPAHAFITELLTPGGADKAYELQNDEAKARMPRDKFAEGARTMAAITSPGLGELSILHSYRIDLSSLGKSEQVAICSTVAHGSIADHRGQALARIRMVPQQAHVLIGGKARNNHWTFDVWLIPSNGNWQVLAFSGQTTTILERTAADLAALATEQAKQGHSFNAAVLLSSAVGLSFHGPGFQEGGYRDLQEALDKLPRPAVLEGKPPFVWRDGAKEFRILQVGPLGVGSNFALVVRQELAEWGDRPAIEAQNQMLLAAVRRQLPEFSAVFDTLIAEAVHQGGTEGFRTVQPAIETAGASDRGP